MPITDKELEEMATPHRKPEIVQKTEAELSYKMPGDTQEESADLTDDDEKEKQASYFMNQKEPSQEPTNNIESNNVEEHKAIEDIPDPKQEDKIKPEPKCPTPEDSNRFDEMDSRLNTMQKALKALKEQNELRDVQIETAMRANIELILVDMETIAEDLNIADKLLKGIGTEEMFNIIHHEKTNRGLNMAFMAAKRYLEDAASNAKQIIPIHQAIKSNMNAVNEKLKYGEDA